MVADVATWAGASGAGASGTAGAGVAAGFATFAGTSGDLVADVFAAAFDAELFDVAAVAASATDDEAEVVFALPRPLAGAEVSPVDDLAVLAAFSAGFFAFAGAE